MERTKGLMVNTKRPLANEELQVLSTLISRAELGSRLGQQTYGGTRDVYEALGYKKFLSFDDYAIRYIRQDIAKAIIDRPAKATWAGPLRLQESKEREDTPFELAWDKLYRQFKLKNIFVRADRLSGIGCFGVILLGLDDVKTLEDYAKPVRSGQRKLVYVKPFGEGAARISSFDIDPTSARYGKPLYYMVQISDITAGSMTEEVVTTSTTVTIKTHYTRVVHIVDDILENEVIGLPRLQAVFNRLTDLEKIIGGDAEMFWRGARPGFQGVVDKDYQMTTESQAVLKDQIDEYENNLRRILVNEGVELKALAQQISDPSKHVDIQLQMVSAVTGIPKSILTGSERGELSSNQDSQEYRTYVQTRRDEYAEVCIIRPFVDYCIVLGILPEPTTETYEIIWSDLFARSEAELVKIGMDRSAALKNYISTPMAEAVISPEAFLQYFLGLTPDEVDVINEMAESNMLRDQTIDFVKDTSEATAVPDQTVSLPTIAPASAGAKTSGPAKLSRKRQPNPPQRVKP